MEPVTDVADQLERLESMLMRGSLTPDEFDRQKRRLLGLVTRQATSGREPRAVEHRDAARARRRRGRVHPILRATGSASTSVVRRIPTSTRSLRCNPTSS